MNELIETMRHPSSYALKPEIKEKLEDSLIEELTFGQTDHNKAVAKNAFKMMYTWLKIAPKSTTISDYVVMYCTVLMTNVEGLDTALVNRVKALLKDCSLASDKNRMGVTVLCVPDRLADLRLPEGVDVYNVAYAAYQGHAESVICQQFKISPESINKCKDYVASLRGTNEQELIEKVGTLYLQGSSMRDIKRQCGIFSENELNSFIDRSGVPRRPCPSSGSPEKEIEESIKSRIIEDYNNGSKVAALSRSYGYSQYLIRKFLTEEGILITKKQKREMKKEENPYYRYRKMTL